MPFTVNDLIAGRPNPITTSRNASVQDALRIMINGDFSQLPVVDSDGSAQGMITSDSITRALSHFDLTIKEMRVFHAMTEEVPTYYPEDELLGLLDDLKNTYAVLAVDKNKRVIGIITSYDTTEYFRRRGEDMMLLEDIETMLKEYVLAAFQDPSGTVDTVALGLAIEEISENNSKLRGPFGRALEHYFKNGTVAVAVDQVRAEEAFSLHINPKQQPRSFEKLTLNDYTELFLHKARWEQYKSVFDLDAGSCRKLLVAVRDIRNELAHFRSEMTPHKREQLRFCKEWLARHQAQLSLLFTRSTAEPNARPNEAGARAVDLVRENDTNIVANIFTDFLKAIRLGKFDADEDIPLQLIESEDARDSRYTPLAVYLQTLPLDRDKEEISFEDIELLIGGRLPPYARQHRSWWANDSTRHVQSIQWLSAGWRVSSVNMSGEHVVFSRIKEREQAYIEFFSKLLADLRRTNDIPISSISPDGQSWINVLRIGSNSESNASFLGFSFARGGQFRVELYIDQGDKERNKNLFDGLQSRAEEIASKVGESLNWERLDNRRASRIAAYRLGTISDAPEVLSEVRHWASRTMIKFYNVFRPLLLQMGHAS
jgi:CBS domain-containing protein